MKLKLIKPVAVKGHATASIGDVIEVIGGDASYLLAIGAAVAVDDAPTNEVIQVREPAIENRDPQPQQSSKRNRAK